MDVSAAVLLKGAWYAAEQCGVLLNHAVILHREKAYSSAIALALLAREELGRCQILLEFWRKADQGGVLPTVEKVREACDDHEEKQRRAQLSISYRAEGPGRLAELLRTLTRHSPQSAEYEQAREELDSLNEIKTRRTPTDRHMTRMKALYVDLNDSGTGWNRPSELAMVDAKNCLMDIANDYAGQVDRLRIEMVRALDTRLAEALDSWKERPSLPPPVWPDWIA